MPAFPPIVGNNPKIIVLGSMPGKKSLDEQRYYAHPRNSFWWIMSRCFQFSESLGYAERLDVLKSNGVALWDVLHDCDRQGSLDNNIVRQSEVCNDFSVFLNQHATIRKILFNGAAAETIFKRHWSSLMTDEQCLQWQRMPSTSPAHAALTREDKQLIWQQGLFA